ncbi:GNAT family N-acetyltransferase [Paenibacillus montanisoli]|uniref:GNAT family N-acetyltransferase n=2 Tax=Paenibacillus montanisoli TaxID=2081970 RepID=A0A328TYT0_9BACL|nr:GNAT family N-acetyltransferase [Paenibacillus montanisoli]
MISDDVDLVFHALEEHYMGKPLDYINKCWEENKSGARITLIALYDQKFAGWLHLLSTSYYPYFVDEGIPEINNFEVVPTLRRKGIGNALMDAIEQISFDKYGIVGIGVGLYYDYGNAQRLYVKRGYIPDGRGVFYEGKYAEPGRFVQIGHELALYLTKEKPAGR